MVFSVSLSCISLGYLQLSSGHFENELHHGADGEAGGAGGVDLVPNGVAVHLETHKQTNTAH